ncbi:hypothetical protein ACET3Z_004389 [Daucus carota]
MRGSLSSVTPASRKLSLVFMVIYTLLLFLSSSGCKAVSSSCGNIQNISCPFTLKGDDQQCDSSFFTLELSCLNNRTILYLLEDKIFYVKSIDYDNLLVRIVDPGFENNNSSIKEDDFLALEQGYDPNLRKVNQPITMMECPSPVISTRYINITSPNSSFSSSVLGKYYVYSYAYIVVGYVDITEMEDNCRISKVAWVSRHSPFSKLSKVFSNFSEIHDALVYGYDIPWSYFYCLKCHDGCDTSSPDHHLWACISFSTPCNLPDGSSYHITLLCNNTKKIIGMFLAARFSLGLPFLLAFLTYKARRRHLSMYNTIEDFLQAQNNLMPIRIEFLYSYRCGGDVAAMAKAREVVDRRRNCEDILMNFVAAEEGEGVMVVEAERIRDYGDSRNEGRSGVESAGLSSRKKDHRKRRGECITEFHRVLGRMPLKYAYGKVVRGVGEQGLCEKGGKLVLCDHQIVD